jgi:hypothetical protein
MDRGAKIKRAKEFFKKIFNDDIAQRRLIKKLAAINDERLINAFGKFYNNIIAENNIEYTQLKTLSDNYNLYISNGHKFNNEL